MRLIVDTYNVVMRDAGLGPDGVVEDAAHLARLIDASRYGRYRTLLVCDGAAPPGLDERRPGFGSGVSLRFAGPGGDADSLIDQLIHQDSAPKRLLVVSSDREVRASARRRRCRTLESARFVTQLIHDASSRRGRGRRAGEPAREQPVHPGAVDEWIRHFGLGKDVLEVPASHPPARRPETPPGERPSVAREGGSDAPKEVDPLLREAMAYFGDRLRIDELDMSRWVDGVRRLPRRRPGR